MAKKRQKTTPPVYDRATLIAHLHAAVPALEAMDTAALQQWRVTLGALLREGSAALEAAGEWELLCGLAQTTSMSFAYQAMDAEIALEAMETKYQQAVTMLATRTVPPHQTA